MEHIRKVLVQRPQCRIARCSCGVYHVSTGAVTLRMERPQLEDRVGARLDLAWSLAQLDRLATIAAPAAVTRWPRLPLSEPSIAPVPTTARVLCSSVASPTGVPVAWHSR